MLSFGLYRYESLKVLPQGHGPGPGQPLDEEVLPVAVLCADGPGRNQGLALGGTPPHVVHFVGAKVQPKVLRSVLAEALVPETKDELGISRTLLRTK